MSNDTPLVTFYSIIGCTLLALAITHVGETEGQEAMPVFMAAMAAGVVLGEIVERLKRRSGTS